jgi:Na+-transporting methylmalonyl-CoA/oxaloacetate decarboxylase gamma subunit
MHLDPTLESAITLAAVGFAIVFLVLSSTALLVFLIRRLDERWQRAEQVVEQQRTDRAPTIDATTAVLIAAAVATMLGGRARIRSVRRLVNPLTSTSSWSAQGRAVLMGSHAISGRQDWDHKS